MKFEAVRLLHAQGVPNHYISNQLYQPVDEDHQKRGSFIILFDQVNATSGSLIASLTNILIREYYRQKDSDPLNALEHTLVRLNEHVKQYTQRHESSQGLALHGTVVLVCDNEIHLTHIGTPHAYLWREQQLIPLSEEHEDSPAFSVITSGEIQNEDILFLASPLDKPEALQHDLTFSLSHTPLYETARAFARLLKQKLERSSEALFLRFNTEVDQITPLYVDKPLETTSEKLVHAQKALAKHSSFLMSGVEFLSQKVTRKAKDTSFKLPKVTKKKDEPAYTIVETTSATEGVLPESELSTASTDEENPLNGSEETSEFQVRNYWQPNQPIPVHAKPHDKPARGTETEHFSPLPRLRLKPRTLYLLVGAFILVALIIRISNTVTPAKEAPVAQTNSERDALVDKAEASAREAEAAYINENVPVAVDKLVDSEAALAQVIEKNQNEKSKALSLRVAEMFKTYTNETALTPTGTPLKLAETMTKFMATSKGIYSFGSTATSVQRITNGTVAAVTGLPSDFEPLDATAYDNFAKLALWGKASDTNKLFTINPDTNEAKEITRTDNKPWTDARLITSFETNLYFVADTMTKATPSGELKYRAQAYATQVTTDAVSTIIANGPGFYAVDTSKDIVRITNNSPKTAVKLSGLPESYLPSTIKRLISTRQDGTLYVFDKDKQRILVFTTDGSYRSQYKLSVSDRLVDCDFDAATFTCLTDKNTLVTLPVTSQ